MGMKEMFLSHGFNDYLSKPVEISKLDDILSAWIPKEKQVTKPADEEVSAEDVSFFPAGCIVEGLNLEAGRSRYPEKTYLEVLRSYTIHTPALLEKLRERKSADEYTVTVHGLKGATFGICAEGIAKQAEALEAASRAGDIPFIDTNNITLINAAEKLVKDLSELLAAIKENEGEKPLSGKPDTVLLKEFADACRHFKASIMDEVLVKLEAYRYESGGELVTWLREQTDNLEYDVILERLDKENE
jgi:CheY-like chemotaxis protein